MLDDTEEKITCKRQKREGIIVTGCYKECLEDINCTKCEFFKKTAKK
jgi:hypothetical protein